MNRKTWNNAVITLIIPLVIYLIFYILQPSRFGSMNSLYIMFQQAIIPSVLAWGLYFTQSLGLFDFSLGSILVFAGIIGGTLSLSTGYVGMFVGCIAISLLLELINGILYIKLKIPSMIVSVGLMMIYEIFGLFFNDGKGVSLPDNLSLFGKAPYNIIVGFITMVIVYLIYNYSRKGIHIRAIGSNELMAKNMGIKINNTKLFGYVICGFFVGIASVLSLSYSRMMLPQMGMASMVRIFTPLMGCFVGTAFKKYCNPIISIFIGEFMLVMIVTGLMTMNVDATIQQVITGTFLLSIVGLTLRQKADVVVK